MTELRAMPPDPEERIRAALRDSLDAARGPHPSWEASPAAHRIADRRRPRTGRAFVRLVGVAAAFLAATGGLALLAGALRADPDGAPPVRNGWVALVISEPITGESDGEDLDIWFTALDAEARRVVGDGEDDVDQLCPAFSPDGRRLAYGRAPGLGARSSPDRGVAELVVATVDDKGQVIDELSIELGDGAPPPCALWSPDGDQLAFAVPRTSPVNPTAPGTGSEIRIVRLADRRVTIIPHVLATDLEWSPDGRRLAIAGGSGEPVAPGAEALLTDTRVQLWDRESGALVTVPGTAGVGSLAWSPDGGRLAVEGGGAMRILDVETGEERFRTNAEANHGIGPVWSPRGDRVAFQRLCASHPADPGRVCREQHEVVLITLHPSDYGAPTETLLVPRIPDGSDAILFPSRVTFSPAGDRLLVMGWIEGADAGAPLLAVPVDAGEATTELDGPPGIAWYEGYPDTAPVPIQAWGRRPLD